MTTSTLHKFIVSTDGVGQGKRARELQLSDIRSHARQVSFLKAKTALTSEPRQYLQHTKHRSTADPTSKRANSPRESETPSSSTQSGQSPKESPESHSWPDREEVLNDVEAEAFLRDVWMPKSSPLWSKADPFDCIPGSNDRSARMALDFLNVTQWCWPAYAAISQSLSLPVLYHHRWLIEQVATYSSLFHIIVAHAKTCHDLLIKPGSGPEQEVQAHKSKSIAVLRKRLLLPKAAFDDGVILTAIFLSHHEAATGNFKAATMHCQRLYHLIAARGGIESFEPGTGIRALVDFFLYLTGGPTQRTNGVSQGYHFPNLPMSVQQLQSFRSLPIGFQDLALTGRLTIETIDMILMILKQKARKQKRDSTGSERARKSSDAQTEARYRTLTEACPGLMMQDSDSGPAMERMVCTALMRTCIDETHRFKTAGSLFQGLTAMLNRLLPLAYIPCEGPERSCLLWMWISMVDSWPAGRDKVLNWLLQTRQRFPEIISWRAEDFDEFGKKYIWTTDLSRIIAGHWPCLTG